MEKSALSLDSNISVDGKEYRVGDLTLKDIQFQVRTGRAVVRRGDGRNKEYAYRDGVKTPIGDIELSLWEEVARALISDKFNLAAEYDACEEWARRNAPWLKTDRDRDVYALDMVVSRLTENALWVEFVPFNAKYFPERLNTVPTVLVTLDCCMLPGEATAARVDYDTANGSGKTHCPLCGRWAKIINIEQVKRGEV